MVAIGPRVGGAHVDVNMKFDDKSLKDVGKRIHKQLTDISDHNREAYRSIGQGAVTAWRGALGVIVTSAPLIGSATSAAAGGVTLLANSVFALGQSSTAALPLVTSLGIAGLTASIGMRNFGAAVSEVDPKKLKLLLSDMPKSMQAAVMSTRAMSKEMRAVIWEKLFVGIGPLMQRLRETGVIQRGLGQMAESLNFMARGVLRYTTSAQGVKTLNQFFTNNAKVFKALSKAVVPFLDGFLRLMNALSPAAIRLAGYITDVAKSFQSWTKGEGFGKRINWIMSRAQNTAGLLIRVFSNLGTALMNVFGHTVGPTNTFLRTLIRITGRFKEFTGSVKGQTAIRDWVRNSREVLEKFGETFRSVFDVVRELADPRVISSFLTTVEGAFTILGKLPLDKMVDAFVRVAEVMQPVSSLFLAVIIAGVSMNIMIGSLLGQFAGLFGILSGIVKFKILTNILKNTTGGAGKAGGAAAGAAKKTGLLSRAWQFLVNIFTKVKNVFSKVTGLFSNTTKATGQVASKAGKLSGAFKPVMSILGRFAKFAGWVGIAVWIGTIIAKSDKLKGKLGNVWDSMKGVGTALSDAFKEIGTALKPLGSGLKTAGKALSPVFDFLDKIAGLAIGVFLDMVVYGFKSLANVIKGVGKIIAGIITIFTGLFTLDFGKVWEGMKQVFSGLGPLLKGAFGLFITFFAPARLFKLAGVAFKGLAGGIKGAMPGILGVVGRLVGGVLRWVGQLPGRLLGLGLRAVKGLAGAVAKGIPKVLSAAGRIFTGVVRWIGRLPGRLLSLGKSAVARLRGAVTSGTPQVLSAAGRIFTGVVNWLAKLPGRLFSLGKTAVTKLGGAVRDGIGKLKNIAGDIFSAITGKLKGLPGDMLEIGKNLLGGLIDGVTKKFGDLKKTFGKIGDTIKGFLPGSPVKEGPLTAWNHGNGATGGGRNIIDAITGGLSNTDPIQRAMNDVASAVSASFNPTASGRNETRRSSRSGPDHTPDGSGGGNIYVHTMMPHNYGEFEKQMRAKKRLAALGGRAG